MVQFDSQERILAVAGLEQVITFLFEFLVNPLSHCPSSSTSKMVGGDSKESN
jgi:hypothetical protein